MAEETYDLDVRGLYIPETQEKIYLEAIILNNKVQIIMRGGPLEPTILEIEGKELTASDYWGWGQG